MKKFSIIILFAILNLLLNAELFYYNVNGFRKLTPKELIELENLPRFERSDYRNQREVPPAIDNSEQIYFPPIINQVGGSCAQASGVYYCFGYEMNRLRDTDASLIENQYPTHFTWNFLNGGEGNGSHAKDGWDIIKVSGCPNIPTYGGSFAYGGNTRWMSGHDNYKSAMSNRIKDHQLIKVDDVEGLNNLKQWLTDCGVDDSVGGIASFAAGVTPMNIALIQSGVESGRLIVKAWDNDVNHAMTIVGYNDSIKYDFNNDGQFTNDIDINGDGIVDLQDYEIGAVKVANSWGANWQNSGYIYMMYRLLATGEDNHGIYKKMVRILNGKEEYHPRLGIKTNISYNKRNKIKFTAGISNDLYSTTPEYFIEYPFAHYQGGEFGMSGNSNDIEFGFDISPFEGLLCDNEPVKFFLQIEEDGLISGTHGEIVDFAVVDYRNNDQEYYSEETNVNIGTGITTITMTNTLPASEFMITNDSEIFVDNQNFSVQMNAINGVEPYRWSIVKGYDAENSISEEGLEIDNSWNLLSPSHSDDGFAEVELPFTFNFYGKDYSNANITTDGSILFEEKFFKVRSLSKLKDHTAISPFGSDLEILSGNEGIYTKVIDNEFWIQWKISAYHDDETDFNFAAILTAENEIRFIYGIDMPNDQDFVSGISDGSGYSYQVSHANEVLHIPDNYQTTFNQSYDYSTFSISENGSISGVINNSDLNELSIIVTDEDGIFTKKNFSLNFVGNEDVASFDNLRIISCYPNPFSNKRSETSIAFGINTPQIVGLEIFNIKGQKVKSIFQKCEAGINEIRWNGKDAKANSVTSGVYFYKVSTSNSEKFGKILRVK
jgi:hypothetical protein